MAVRVSLTLGADRSGRSTGARSARTAALILILIGCLAQRGDGADKPVELLYVQHYITDETPIAFSLRILPREANRRFTVAAINEVGDPERSSEEDLPGPTTRVIEWNPLAAGDYELVAVVLGAEDKILARTSAHLTVLAWRGP